MKLSKLISKRKGAMWVALALLFLAQQISRGANPEPPMHPISHSDMSRLYGLHLNIIDDHSVEYFHFLKEGYVAATLGMKGGPVCAPLLKWSLSKEGILSISENEIQFKWSAIAFVKDEVYVRSDGETERFTAVKEKK